MRVSLITKITNPCSPLQSCTSFGYTYLPATGWPKVLIIASALRLSCCCCPHIAQNNQETAQLQPAELFVLSLDTASIQVAHQRFTPRVSVRPMSVSCHLLSAGSGYHHHHHHHHHWRTSHTCVVMPVKCQGLKVKETRHEPRNCRVSLSVVWCLVLQTLLEWWCFFLFIYSMLHYIL